MLVQLERSGVQRSGKRSFQKLSIDGSTCLSHGKRVFNKPLNPEPLNVEPMYKLQ